jgi:DNA-binding NtrC family response regulator
MPRTEKGENIMSIEKINILVVDDEEAFLQSMTKRLTVRDFNVTAVNRGDKALEAAKHNSFDIALVDLKMPGMNGEATLEALKKEHPFMEVVILTGHGSIDSAVECTRSGAYCYLQKPCDLDYLLQVLSEAFKKRLINKKNIRNEQLEKLLDMVDSSSPLAILRKMKELDGQNI